MMMARVQTRFNFLHDMRRENDCLLGACFTDDFPDFDNLIGIQAGSGLIQYQHTGVMNQCLGKPDPLAYLSIIFPMGLLISFVKPVISTTSSIRPGNFRQFIETGYKSKIFTDIQFRIQWIVFRANNQAISGFRAETPWYSVHQPRLRHLWPG